MSASLLRVVRFRMTDAVVVLLVLTVASLFFGALAGCRVESSRTPTKVQTAEDIKIHVGPETPATTEEDGDES